MLDSDTPGENATPDSTLSSTENPESSATSDTQDNTGDNAAAPVKKTAAKRATKKAAAKSTAKKSTTKKTAAKRTTKKAAAEPAPAEPAAEQPTEQPTEPPAELPAEQPTAESAEQPAKKTAKKAATKSTAKKTTAKKATPKKTAAKRTTKKAAAEPAPEQPTSESAPAETPPESATEAAATEATPVGGVAPLFQPPDVTKARPARKRTTKKAAAAEPEKAPDEAAQTGETAEQPQQPEQAEGEQAERPGQTEQQEQGEGGTPRRRRRRGGRRRRKSGGGENGESSSTDESSEQQPADAAPEKAAARAGDRSDQKSEKSEKSEKSGDKAGEQGDQDGEGGSGTSTSRRRRRRRRSGEDGDAGGADDPENTVTRVRKARSPEDEITALSGSTRLEAKKQRRREGREAGRRRAPIVSEAEFLARRESVDRVMVIRQRKDLTQIAVLEDKVLVEHYVARESQTSLIGNVYLGKVQNVLPSMEAAFIDIGKGRNAVLYAGEVNWDSLGAGNGPRKIEQVLKSGQNVLVQVTKDPVGHKGARLTSQISLPGRFLVYVPDGTTSGISRKLPDTERNRLKSLLKEIVPESAGVIVRTAAEGASEEELTRDVERLKARWEDIAAKVEKGGGKGGAPQLLYGEPDLTLKVVRDLFTEDFAKLVVSGDEAWETVEPYVKHVAPDLVDRLEKYDGDDAFAAYRIDEQIAKALDRKVWLPSGGSLIIDRTEAMTVIDVNTGKFTGSGGNLEETVTKNNLEAAEEIVRQLRLRDIGGIIVVDFIDMVLESNRDLVLRRMVECLGRDRTRHQVAEVTSLGLVQMTRKRIGTGLLEAFSEPCEHCQGRGLIVHHEPVDPKKKGGDEDSGGASRRSRRSRRGRGDEEGSDSGQQTEEAASAKHGPTPAEFAAMAGKAAAEKAAEEEKASREEGSEEAAAKVAADTRDEQPETQPESTPEPTPESEREPEREPEPEPVPATPTVVTSTRRRVARRPAGPPAGAAAATIVADPPETTEASADGDGSTLAGESEQSVAAHVPVKKRGSRKR